MFSLNGKFHFFSDNTLTLSLFRAPVAVVGSETWRQPVLMQFSTDLCDALRLYICAFVCVHASWEGCGKLACPNGFKLCKNKWTPSVSTSSSLTLSLWQPFVLCQALTQMALETNLHCHHPSYTHSDTNSPTSSRNCWHGTSDSSSTRHGVRALQKCGWMKRDDLSGAKDFDKRLIITLNWWRCRWGLRRTTGMQYS